MILESWGRYIKHSGQIQSIHSQADAVEQITKLTGDGIPRGLGRSYGDSALSDTLLDMNALDHLIAFDASTGILTAYAGASLADLLQVFVPKGWFLPVTPGTEFVTLGGAIASDVHGKNHHLSGSFSDHLISIKVATVSEGIIECSHQHNSDLFKATCGGMGLTGLIVEATLQLTPITSALINEKIYKIPHLKALLEHFDQHQQSTYSVAWIDCLAKGDQLGRSLLMLGEHAEQGPLTAGRPGRLSLPVELPISPLTSLTTRAFNQLYYCRIRKPVTERRVHYQPFFYPLDGIQHWNRLYGRQGFLQYQCVIPFDVGYQGVHSLLSDIAASQEASFLAVLKVMGEQNANYLSFPMKGFTLAMDFKYRPNIPALLERLDAKVLEMAADSILLKMLTCPNQRLNAAIHNGKPS
jgi:decaprenylphospho-beta-D-ribofuranose 2-oxidase